LGLRDGRSVAGGISRSCRRYASGEAASKGDVSEDLQDLESNSSLSSAGTLSEKISAYDPVKRAQGRRRQLPASRYIFNCMKRTGVALT